MQLKNEPSLKQQTTRSAKQQDFSFTKTTRTVPAISAAAVRVSNQQARAKRAGWFILFLCLALAVLTTVLVPLLVGGASPVIAGEPTVLAVSSQAPKSQNSYTSLEEAQQELGFVPQYPVRMPEGSQLRVIRVVEGKMLEMEYSVGSVTLLYRTAQGNEDLSDPARTYAFSTTESGDLVCCYAGATENKLCLAAWADDGCTFAIQASNDIAADTMKEIVLGVA